MHTLRHALFATGLLLTLPSISTAAVPVEMRPLTPSPLSAATAAANASSSASGTAETPTDQTSVLWKLYQQVQDLQQEVRSLRGRFESQEQQLDATDKELKARFTDLDQRFDQFKSQQTTAVATPTTDSTTDAASTNTSATPTTGMASTANTVTGGTTNSGNTNSAATYAASNDADKRAYVSAYDAYKAGGAAQAIGPMQAFIRQYPTSVYVPNAHYWLGEFYLAVTPPDFKLAAQSFSVTSLTYPKSAKAAAATYRLATMADVDNRPADATRLMTRLINDYAGTQEAGFAEAYIKTHRSKPAPAKPASTALSKPSATTSASSAAGNTTSKPKAPTNNTKPTQLAPPLPSSGTNKASSNTKRTEPKAVTKDTVKTKTTSTSKNVQ